MQGIDQQIMQLYEATTHLIALASLVMFSVVAYVVLVNGRSSTERTLIGIGAALKAMSLVIGMGMSLLLRFGPLGGHRETVFMFYAISQLISFVGLAMGLWGAVKLLHRAAHMELLLQDPDDDR